MDVVEVKKLDAYLKRVFGNSRIRIVPGPGADAPSGVFIGEEKVGDLDVDEDEGERSYNFRMEFQLGQGQIADQNAKLDAYLRRKFDNENIRVVTRAKKTDSVEAYLGEEFIGVVFIENDKGQRSYILEMPILDMDLA